MRDYRPFLDHHNTVLHGMRAVITVLQNFTATIDLYVVADIGILINDSIFDAATVADTHYR